MSIPVLSRPIFEGLTTNEDKMAAAMAEYNDMKDPGEDGLDFSNKTSMWIAYERDLESQREDSLFEDPLAKDFSAPYGKRLSESMSFGLSLMAFDTPGFGLEGHVMYTAARTKLINDRLSGWLDGLSQEEKECQVVNLGAGFDTRQYWLECLKKSKLYWEVDTASVMSHKQKVLNLIKEEGDLPDLLCECKSITMDFSRESISGLPTDHEYDKNIPTAWILEGLIMYLKRDDVEQLIDNICELSASNSYMILNFSNNVSTLGSDACPSINEIDERLEVRGWQKEAHLMFGDEGFNFGRYPVGEPPNKTLGFATFRKI